ncbi:hypothetical protein I3842_12G018400 [Carya illinoinensis]|uniref:Uncharacterized protein n=1 Tax=Carya illinoinensis TaxID=32201 RepID=A0A922DFP1_CARIL|nr:hypothetical protein I3842_12G018400 [Carya illinoinensis]
MFRANLSVLFARLIISSLEEGLYVLFLLGPVLCVLPTYFGFFNLFRGWEKSKFECSFTLSICLWVESVSMWFLSSNSFLVCGFVSSVLGLFYVVTDLVFSVMDAVRLFCLEKLKTRD